MNVPPTNIRASCTENGRARNAFTPDRPRGFDERVTRFRQPLRLAFFLRYRRPNRHTGDKVAFEQLELPRPRPGPRQSLNSVCAERSNCPLKFFAITFQAW